MMRAMTQDYARQHAARKQPPKRPRTPARRQQAQSGGFSWGSFAAGLVLGIGFTLAGALLPQLLADQPSPQLAAVPERNAPAPEPVRPQPEFTFWDQLPSQQSPAAAPRREAAPATGAAGTQPAEAVEYLLQAGSFSRLEDAERLRANLLLLGLEASTTTVTLPGGATRHRVLVGPFDDERAMRRAQSRLREQDIDPLPLRRTPGQATG